MDAETLSLRDEFVAESRDHLDLAEKKLLALEGMADAETVNELFRAIHTVKGGAGFFKLGRLGGLAHVAETLLSKVRDGSIQVDKPLVDVLLESVDQLLGMLARDDLGEGADTQGLFRKLQGFATSNVGASATAPAPVPRPVAGPQDRSTGSPSPPPPAETVKPPRADAVAVPHAAPPAPAAPAPSGTASSAIRVGVEVLDELLELIGEVVLGRNQLITRHQNDPAFTSLSRSITRLHQHVIRTRMQHVGSLFERYRRTVRDLSQHLGKKVEIIIEGGDLELDRTVIERLADPITHLVRNSVDHGLETAEERSQRGKQVMGTIVLRAVHESGQVMIEVEDDGRGIDVERVRAKAVERGLVTEKEAALLSTKDVNALIFHPGFSTKDVPTELSGRGVGMDVVKSNLEKLGCSVEVSSRPGKGTIVSISIPLTQAMVNSSVISGLIVGIDRYTLAIPQLAVNEIVRVLPEDRAERIEKVRGHEVFKLRDKVVPLVHLEDILGVTRAPTDAAGVDSHRGERLKDGRHGAGSGASSRRGGRAAARSKEEIFIVLHSKQNWFGILVDRIVGTEEIVVRRSPEILKGRRIFSGSTILGDGTVSLILDIGGMVEAAALDFDDRTRDFTAHMRRSSVREVEQRVVVFTNADEEYFAIPVNLLSEVDRCSTDEIRRVGSREFIQRHNASVPLLRLEKQLNVSPLDERRKSFVILTPSRVAYPTAIAAGRIVETIVLGEDINTREEDERGIMGTFFSDGRLVNLLDIYSLLQFSDPDRHKTEMRPTTRNCRVLLAEDQLFFRQLVTRYFHSHGIQKVVACADGRQAFDELSQNPDSYDVVISDIEMPVLNGYQLVAMIKSDARFSRLPVMALTALEGEENVQKGFEAGFDAYEIKLDKEKVIRCLDRLLDSGPRPR